MSIYELILISIGLAMDAFAVSVCSGLRQKKFMPFPAFITALFFGVFQALMPMAGYFLGSRFSSYIVAFDHWIAFGLLAFIGGNMIREAIKDDGDEEPSCSCTYILNLRELTLMAIATSIDALAVGITFAFLQVSIVPAACVIGGITFVIAFMGVVLGNKFGSAYKNKAEMAGGVILIAIGLKILIEHLT